MNQEHIIEIADDYLATPKTDYAICINGKWGCGKTYLWKNILAPKFMHTSKKVLYISLFGKKSSADIDVSITMSLLPEMSSKVKQLASSMGQGLLNYRRLEWIKEVIPVRTFINFKNTVFCFDDFERAGMDEQSVLGYINSFTEHEGAKVFILINEEKLKDRSSYRKYKEKVMGISIDYQAATNLVIENIFCDFLGNEKYFKFLLDNVDIVHRVYVNSETGNIRILKNSLYLFQKAFDYLSAEESLLAEEYGKSFLNFFLAVSFEIHTGTITKENLTSLADLSENLLQLRVTRLLTQEEGPNYIENFFSKYYSASDLSQPAFKSIFDYVSTGYLDTSLLLRELHELDNTYEPEEIKKLKKYLREIWELNDKEFLELTVQLYEEVKNGKLERLSSFWRLFVRFITLKVDGIINYSIEEIVSNFKSGADIAFNCVGLIDWDLGYAEKPSYQDKTYNLAIDEVHIYYSKISKMINDKAKQGEAQSLIKALQQNMDTFEKVLDRNATDNIINLIDNDEWLAKIVDLDPKNIAITRSIFYSRYRSVNIFDFLNEEKEVLRYLRDNLLSYLNPDIGLVKMWALKQFHRTISAICDRIPAP
ncbi:MAG: KAP family NTPase [Desulfarculaceae bacterium]|nr:KAP family NTPase [Desulfarculaceae bacterium]MCF8072155.1 KAP family NTPase [Desulfarculaceae bacterium]MCF8100076.1 KAP family NTPase [Desulfarculaceae bacterium]MCF8118497.1 KAP family NTPase [Desulfarculaceae bacterium]